MKERRRLIVSLGATSTSRRPSSETKIQMLRAILQQDTERNNILKEYIENSVLVCSQFSKNLLFIEENQNVAQLHRESRYKPFPSL